MSTLPTELHPQPCSILPVVRVVGIYSLLFEALQCHPVILSCAGSTDAAYVTTALDFRPSASHFPTSLPLLTTTLLLFCKWLLLLHIEVRSGRHFLFPSFASFFPWWLPPPWPVALPPSSFPHLFINCLPGPKGPSMSTPRLHKNISSLHKVNKHMALFGATFSWQSSGVAGLGCSGRIGPPEFYSNS